MGEEEIKSSFNTALSVNERLSFGWLSVMQNSSRDNFPEWNSALSAIGRELRHLMNNDQKEKHDNFFSVLEDLEGEFKKKMYFIQPTNDERFGSYQLRREYDIEDYKNYRLFKQILIEFDTFLREIQEKLDLGLAKRENPRRAIAS